MEHGVFGEQGGAASSDASSCTSDALSLDSVLSADTVSAADSESTVLYSDGTDVDESDSDDMDVQLPSQSTTTTTSDVLGML